MLLSSLSRSSVHSMQRNLDSQRRDGTRPASAGRRRSSAARPKAAGYSTLFCAFYSSPFSLAPKNREHQRAPPWRSGGRWRRRRRWPPCRCARSPAGVRAAVERLSGGARTRASVGPDTLRASVRTVRAQGGAGGGGDGEVGVQQVDPLPRPLLF
jgi:hypothetical protein